MFYQKDRDNMQRFPQHYGLIKGSNSGRKEENKDSAILLTEFSQPDEQRIKHSVLKGLWFPIMNNLTNLIMEKRREI